MNEKLKVVSDLFKESWAQYKQYFNSLAPIMLIAGIGVYLQTVVLYFEGGLTASVNRSVYYNGENMAISNAHNGILYLLASLVAVVGLVWGFTALLNRVNHLTEQMTLKQSFMAAKPFLVPIVLTGLLAGVLTLLGFILLIIPGIIIGVWFSFTYFVVIVENKKYGEALKASKNYVKGYWWAVFGRIFLMGIVIAIASGILGMIAHLILGLAIGMILQNAIGFVLIPFAILYEYNLYKNIRAIKDGSMSTMPASATPPAMGN